MSLLNLLDNHKTLINIFLIPNFNHINFNISPYLNDLNLLFSNLLNLSNINCDNNIQGGC